MSTTPIPTMAPIRTFSPADSARASDVLLLAFGSDPICRWVWPDARQYLAAFPRFVAAFGGAAFAQATAFGLSDGRAAALWLPPGVKPDEEELAAVLLETVPETRQEDTFAFLAQMDTYHPREPHWYLPLIGVDPAHQGKGYGSDLLRHALALCDRDGTPAYLESSNPKNIPLYARHGFELLGSIQAGDSPTMYPMLRTPR